MKNKQLDNKKNCVSNFSLYTHLVCNGVINDPFEEERAAAEGAENGGEWKQKLSKSTKKRLRRLKKKKLLAQNTKIAPTIKKVPPQALKKKSKKDLKILIKKLSIL